MQHLTQKVFITQKEQAMNSPVKSYFNQID